MGVHMSQKARYDDIIAAIEQAPWWWDEHGVPRYGDFEPAMCGDPEARQALLAQVACPHCRHTCTIACSMPRLDLDIVVDLNARGIGGLYGLLPHFKHCGRPTQGELIIVEQLWRRDVSMVIWRQVL